MTFAVIEDGRCVNIVQAEAWYAKMKGFVELPEQYGVGDFYNNGEWCHDKPSTIEERVSTLETEVYDISSAIERGLNL